MNIRIERLNDQFQEEISEILRTEVKNQEIHFVTITGCEITSDLSYCKVFYTVLEEEKRKSVQEALDKTASFIRGQLSQRIEIRHTPELKFVYDESIAYGNHIEKLIEQVHEKEKKEE